MNNHEAKRVILEADSCFCKHGAYKDCHSGCKYREALDAAVKALEQEPKTGHWIPTYGNVKCSVCGSVKDSREVGRATHYCDFCGAKMEGEV